MTIKQLVQDHLTLLQTFTRPMLTDWGRENGMNSAPTFARFKKELLAVGIDYESMKPLRSVCFESAPEQGTSGALVRFFSDAKAKKSRFAICNHDGAPVWHGQFFDDPHFNGEQSSGEMAAARKAVWLACKIRQELGFNDIELELTVDAQWLCFANEVRRGGFGGGKARELGFLAKRYKVILTVKHIPGIQNPADKFTICRGHKHWSDNDLNSLVVRTNCSASKMKQIIVPDQDHLRETDVSPLF